MTLGGSGCHGKSEKGVNAVTDMGGCKVLSVVSWLLNHLFVALSHPPVPCSVVLRPRLCYLYFSLAKGFLLPSDGRMLEGDFRASK